MDPLAPLWLAFSEAPDFGAVRLHALADLHDGAAGLADAVDAGRPGATEVLGRPITDREALRALRPCLRPSTLRDAERRLRTWEAEGVVAIHAEHPAYPRLLAHEPAPPPILFLRGTLPDALSQPLQRARTVTIVGTRRASPWGASFATRLARDLADAGVVVVSGLALGIDGAAHRGALQAEGGRTVAVLGSGFDRVHPPTHRGLAREIAGRGALLSEHPPPANARPEHFPRRNRIVAALGRAVVVVEARVPSGTESTVQTALDGGRSVFVVPQRPGSAAGEGAFKLLQQGATPLASAEDVLAELEGRPPGQPPTEDRVPVRDPLQREILAALRRQGGGGVDALAPPGVAPSRVRAALTGLALAGRIRPDGAGGWRAT